MCTYIYTYTHKRERKEGVIEKEKREALSNEDQRIKSNKLRNQIPHKQ